MPEKIIDPVSVPSVLSAPETLLPELDFDALSQSLGGLEGRLDKKPKTAAIILARASASATKAANSWSRLRGAPFSRGRPRRSTPWATWASSSSWRRRTARRST